MKIYFTISISLLCFTMLISDSTKKMTLHDFMEDYVELAEKKFKKGDKEALQNILAALPDLAIAEEKERWKKITDEALESGKLLSSCKNCHKEFKKSYKKTYKKRLVEIPTELLKK
jgi:hypothetical protein